MSITAVIYFIVKFIELFVIAICGIAISRLPKDPPSKRYWQIAIWAILAYALGEGLRWGHLNDYNYLCETYYSIKGFLDLDRNPLWSTIIYTCRILGIRYNLFIVLQCGFLFYSIMLLVKDYSKYAAFILPLALIGVLANENYIRWFTTFAFVLIGIHYYINSKSVKALFFLFLAVITHFGYIFIFIIFLLFKLLDKLNLNPTILCVLLALFILFADVTLLAEPMNQLSLFLMSMGLTEDVNEGFVYLGTVGTVMEGGLDSGISASSIYAKILRLLIHVPVILFAKKIVPSNIPYYNAFYNIYAIGIITGQLFLQVELMSRYSIILVFFFCIVAGIFYKYLLRNHKSLFYQLVVIIGIIAYSYPYINAPFVRNDKDMYFLWDSNGQEYNLKY